MISVQNLTKYYGTYRALSDVSFEVNRGEILGFLGPNAAGKTTTMRILTCFMPATSGTATIAGYDIFTDSIEVKKRIGYLPETVPLYMNMTVSEYLQFVAEIKKIPRTQRENRRRTVIDECGLGSVRHKLIGTLSKGYKQRVGLAQALINKPDVIILDEPTIGLDPKQIVEIRSLIKSLGGEHTVILSSHILPEVSMICERVIIINQGRVVAIDTPENLSAQLGKGGQISIIVDGSLEVIKSAIGKIRGITAIRHTESQNSAHTFVIESQKDMDIRRHVAAAVVNAGFGLMEMKSIALSLEEVFVKLVTSENDTDYPEPVSDEEEEAVQ